MGVNIFTLFADEDKDDRWIDYIDGQQGGTCCDYLIILVFASCCR